MTTKNRMFGKNILNSSKLLKVMSIILATCMLISLSACGGAGASQQDVQPTTQYATVDPVSDVPEDPAGEPDDGYWHEDPTEDPSVNEDPTTQPQTGAYTYDVYGVTISMDINVDDYIRSTGSGEWFLLADMAYDLGWAGNDTFTAVDTSDPTTYSSQWFAHHDGDLTTRIDIGCYNEEQVTGTNGHQFRTLNVRFITGDNSNYYEGGDSDILHRNLTCDFARHYDNCAYKLNGTGWYASYEDIVMITYMFWSAAENTGNNPLVPVFGTDSGTFGASVDSSTISYSFP